MLLWEILVSVDGQQRNESVKNEQFWVWISKCLDSQDKNPTEEKWWAQESWWDSFCLGGCLMGWTDKNRNEKSRNSASRVLRNFVVQYCEFQTRWYLRFEISFSLLTHSRYHHCQCFFFFRFGEYFLGRPKKNSRDFREIFRKVTGNQRGILFWNTKYQNFSPAAGYNEKSIVKLNQNQSNLAKIAPEGRENFWDRKYFRFLKTKKKNTDHCDPLQDKVWQQTQ